MIPDLSGPCLRMYGILRAAAAQRYVFGGVQLLLAVAWMKTSVRLFAVWLRLGDSAGDRRHPEASKPSTDSEGDYQ